MQIIIIEDIINELERQTIRIIEENKEAKEENKKIIKEIIINYNKKLKRKINIINDITKLERIKEIIEN